MIEFEILIDDFFLNIDKSSILTPIEKKKVLSLLNDYEEGEWRYGKFQNFVWNNIAETALSVKEREALLNKTHSSLMESAKKLRLTDIAKDQNGQASELAEIVLYGIMKHYYKALPVVPKIFYKQNSQDNAKGADSVHIVVENDSDFSLWFGEAKFYSSIDDNRLNSIVQSIENSLEKDKIKKENSIITNVSDLDLCLPDNLDLAKKIKELLSPEKSLDILKHKIHIPILLLHECKITADSDCLSDEYRAEIKEYHKERAKSYFAKQINKLSTTIFKYSEINFHLILFPVPAKQPIVDRFVSNVQHYKNQ